MINEYLRAKAAAEGQAWAERVCRAVRGVHESWPDTDKAWAIARRLVARIAKDDPVVLEELAEACMAAAAEWWRRRPANYRL